MNALVERLRKNSTLEHTEVLEDSKFFNEQDNIPTIVPAMNVAYSGSVDEGFIPGLILFCGNSKMFKTGYGLLGVKSYFNKYDDAVCLFYNNEFGAPKSYWESYDIPLDRVVHSPFTDIEQLTFDLMKQLQEIKRGDHVIIFIDSIGNAASKREVENALKEHSAEDMTRAKKLKGLFRMITPHLSLLNIPCIAINHIYMEQGMFPKAIVSGGSGPYLSADEIFIVTRRTDKDGQEIQGFDFVLNVEKSRHVKEKSKIPISISYKNGIDRYSAVFDWAVEAGFIQQAGAWYQLADLETGEVSEGAKKMRAAHIGSDILDQILANDKFKEFIKNKYRLTAKKMVDDSTDDEADEYIGRLDDDSE